MIKYIHFLQLTEVEKSFFDNKKAFDNLEYRQGTVIEWIDYGDSFPTPLTCFAITFLGGGAVIFLKAFLQSLGSKLGEKLVARWFSDKDRLEKEKKKEQIDTWSPSDPLAIIVEIAPGTFLLEHIKSPSELSKKKSEVLLKKVESAQAQDNLSKGVYIATFSKVEQSWKFVYYSDKYSF